MTKRLILAFVFLSWHLVACSNGDSGISSGLPDKPSADKTISPIIKTITSKTDFALKYQHPYTKHILNNTAKISADSINASLLFPFAYQQTKANNGETAVNPNQIIA